MTFYFFSGVSLTFDVTDVLENRVVGEVSIRKHLPSNPLMDLASWAKGLSLDSRLYYRQFIDKHCYYEHSQINRLRYFQ